MPGPFGVIFDPDVFFTRPADRMEEQRRMRCDVPRGTGGKRQEGCRRAFAQHDSPGAQAPQADQAGQRDAHVGAAAARIEIDRSTAARRNLDEPFEKVIVLVGEVAGDNDFPGGWTLASLAAFGWGRSFHNSPDQRLFQENSHSPSKLPSPSWSSRTRADRVSGSMVNSRTPWPLSSFWTHVPRVRARTSHSSGGSRGSRTTSAGGRARWSRR